MTNAAIDDEIELKLTRLAFFQVWLKPNHELH